MTTCTATGLVQQIVEGTGQLYSLPAAAAEVLRLTAEPRIDVRRVKECLELDPALTTRILKVVNSSLFGLSRPVSDLGQALGLLGTRPLRMLVLGFSLPKALFAGLEAEVLGRYWRHSLIKAVAARELAERLWKVPGDEAFTAGLVQDIGMLALCQQVGPSFLQFVDLLQKNGGSLIDREIETLGFDHLVLTARLLSHWGLPAGLCAAISVPPEERAVAALAPAERTLPQILHLAELAARLVEQPYGPALHYLLAIGGRYCGLAYADLQPVIAVLQAKVEQLAEVLDLTLPEGESYTDLLIAAHTRLAELSLSEAAAQAAADPEEDLLSLTAQLRSDVAQLRATGSRPISTQRGCLPASGNGAKGEKNQRGADFRSQPAQGAYASANSATVTTDLSLLGRLAAAIGRCRQVRCGLTLALVEVDDLDRLALELGPPGLADLLHELQSHVATWSGHVGPAAVVADGQYALCFEGGSRSEALSACREVLRHIKGQPVAALSEGELTASIGVATIPLPPKNFPAHELLKAAQRCLSGAKLSGGDTLKSIEF
jgi:HD-like signal output (HDOD) protein